MKKIISYSLIFAVLLISSCSSGEDAIPAGILPVEKMADIIIGMNISEAVIVYNNLPDTKNKKDLKFNVFKENGVARQDYFKSMEYYTQHPEQLKLIYKTAMEKLNVMKQKG